MFIRQLNKKYFLKKQLFFKHLYIPNVIYTQLVQKYLIVV